MKRTAKKRKRTLSCADYMADRASANRDRQVEQVFCDLERDALRERLNIDTPTREKEQHDSQSQQS
jgi:hypothetical protein